MPYATSSNFIPPDFCWPEPLVIDAIGACYDEADDWTVAARAHALYLRELIDGEPRRSASLRLKLIACCAARGIASEAIETADRAAMRELSRIVQARFRNSPRARLHHVRRLRAALDQLPGGHHQSAGEVATPPARCAGRRLEPLRLT